MNTTKKITCSAFVSAFAVVIMLFSNIPTLTFAVPAIAGIVFVIPMIEFNFKWGFLCFVICLFLSFIVPTDKSSLTLFLVFFGYYPMLKLLIEKIDNRILEYIIKFACLNVAGLVSFLTSAQILGIEFPKNPANGFLATVVAIIVALNGIFLIYDIGLGRLISAYFARYRKTIRKILNLR